MPPATSGGASCYFVSINRNKKSVVIDLKHHDGQRIARNLALKADVLIENFIPGTMQKLGSLDYANLSTINPRLVYCSISGTGIIVTVLSVFFKGYGQTGPYANKGGYDVIVEAIGGLMHITGSSSVDSEPCKAGVAVVDMMTGLYAHGAIMAALMQRNTTGRGQHIDCNLLSTQVN
jgi:succinate--hydroxymethylglutarate CoA-transferase